MSSSLIECKMCKAPIGYLTSEYAPIPSIICVYCQYAKEEQEKYIFTGFIPQAGEEDVLGFYKKEEIK